MLLMSDCRSVGLGLPRIPVPNWLHYNPGVSVSPNEDGSGWAPYTIEDVNYAP
jgi:hypothetical protein